MAASRPSVSPVLACADDRVAPARNAGFADCDNDIITNGCETLLNTTSNCGQCGLSCPSSNSGTTYSYTCNTTLPGCVANTPVPCNTTIQFDGVRSNLTHVIDNPGQGIVTLVINSFSIVSASLLCCQAASSFSLLPLKVA